MERLKTWIRVNRKEFGAICLILVIATIMRTWRINEYMTFLGDEGRDVRIVSKIVTQGDLTFIGPMTSVTTSSGHMYLGPAYYYLMAPALLLSNLSPMGPALMVALLSVLTCGLIWWVGRTWFAPMAGLIAALVFAISPTIIIYSRSSWNPNVMPLFALLAIWFGYLARKNPKWWIGSSAMIALALQSHYLGLILVPVVGFIWVESVWNGWKNDKKIIKNTWKYSLWAIGVFGLFLIPQLLFESKHGWINMRALTAFFTERQTSVNLKFYKRVGELWPLVKSIFNSIIGGISFGRKETSLTVEITMAALGLTTLLGVWKKKISFEYLVMLVWFGLGILGLLSYKQNIFDHYLGFMYPLLPLMFGWLIWQISEKSMIWDNCGSCMQMRKFWAVLLTFGIIFQLLINNPLQSKPNRQWQKTQEIADLIIEKSNGKPFNLGLIADGNYDEGYRYALERKKSKLVAIDPQIKDSTTDQLFVICEMNCNPIGHAQSEIANFGWAVIEDQYQAKESGFKVYKLGHYVDGKEN